MRSSRGEVTTLVWWSLRCCQRASCPGCLRCGSGPRGQAAGRGRRLRVVDARHRVVKQTACFLSLRPWTCLPPKAVRPLAAALCVHPLAATLCHTLLNKQNSFIERNAGPCVKSTLNCNLIVGSFEPRSRQILHMVCECCVPRVPPDGDVVLPLPHVVASTPRSTGG